MANGDVASPPRAVARLSFGQESLWFLDRLGLAGAAYNNLVWLRLAGRLDPGALGLAIEGLVERHEVLRTRFVEQDGQPVQIIEARPRAALLMRLDLSDLPPDTAQARLLELRRREATQRLDLAAAPPWRATLVRLSPSEHELVVAIHHIISDGWSLRAVLVRDLEALYRAALTGAPSGLAPLVLQFADYVAWERERLNEAALTPHLDYWRERLRGAPDEIGLPFDRPRREAESFAGGVVEFTLPTDLTMALKTLAHSEAATLFMVLAAAFQALLCRWCGQTDIMLGLPIAARARREAEALIGFFVNTLVLRTQIDPRGSFRTLLKVVKAGLIEAYAHQELPFDRLVAELNPQRDLSRQSLFQVMFEFGNFPRAELALPELALTNFDSTVVSSKFDLSLNVRETAGELRGSFEYATDLFDRETVERLAERWRALLAAVAAEPDGRLAEVSLVVAEERRLLLGAWMDTRSPYPSDQCLHRLFELQAAATPAAEALTWPGGRMSYAELDRRANALAIRLRESGVGPDTPVALYQPRGPLVVVSVLAVLKAGGAYLPLDPRHPADRIAYMLQESCAPVILADPAIADELSPYAALLIDPGAPSDDANASAPKDLARPDNLAYVLYTSGSTGRPKGVAMPHRPLVNLICWTNAAFPRSRGRRVVQLAPMTFDIAFQEMFSALLAGDTLCIQHDDLRFDAAALRRMLDHEAIDDLMAPQTVLDGLAEVHAAAPGAPQRLLNVIQGGEPLRLTPAMARLFGDWPGARLHNVYGPTETHVVTWSSLPADPTQWPASASIGRPIWNTRTYVLDADMGLAPIGAPGELYLAGDCLARGYLNRPALTAERFLPSPYGVGERLYRTGDVVRWRADGELDFLGRADHQVKIRGLRIELGEIETVLLSHPAVSQAVVIAREDQPNLKRLVAYVVGAGGVRPDMATLRAHLGAKLPDYMIPMVVTVDHFALSANGKIDRKALPAPNLADEPSGVMAPRSGVEQLLAEIWGDVLGRDFVGVESNFFELGGHSLSAARVAARVRSVFGVDLPVRILFERQTIAALAQFLNDADRGPAVQPIQRRPDPSRARASSAQERLLFLERLSDVGPAFNLPLGLRLKGQLDPAALGSALDALVARHESLRTRFETEDGQGVQVIDPPGPARLETADLSDLNPAMRERAVAAAVHDHVHRRFDLQRGPLFRALLLRLSETEHVLAMAAHHVILDGWSTGVLVGDLGRLYAARAGGGDDPAPLPIQYGDFATWQQTQADGKRRERELDYWRGRLADAPPALDLPCDYPRPPRQTWAGAGYAFDLPADLVEGLRRLARAEGATMYMVLLAAFQMLLARWSNQSDIVVGSPVAGRDTPATEGLIGLFMNVIALRTDLTDDPPFREALSRGKAAALGAFANQDTPFERLVQELRPSRDPARAPIFQVLLALQNTPPAAWAAPGLTATSVRATLAGAKYDLSLYLSEEAGVLRGYVEYATALFAPASITRFAARFENLLRAVVADPDLRLTAWPWLAADERLALLELAIGPEVDIGAEATVHGLIATAAARTPDATALIGADGARQSFGELEARAGAVARTLRQRGAGVETVVAVCMERSQDLAAVMLGVMKAGAAYLPLDPNQPARRLAHMISEAAPLLTVAESQFTDLLPDAAPVWVIEEADLAAIDQGPTREPPCLVSGENLAYVIFTSGSTGAPKGVMGLHAGCVNRIRAQAALTPAPDSGVYAQKGSIAFVDSLFELLIPLAHGRPVAIMPSSRAKHPAKLATALREAGVTRLVTVPTLAAAMEVGNPAARPPPLQSWVLSGEILSAGLAASLKAALPDCRLINVYGSTEVTADATAAYVDGDGSPPSIGRPLPNARVYVLGPDLEPTPMGVAGEIWVGGRVLTRGYLGKPALTADRYAPNPFGPPGARMFRTGDLGRWRGDGQLEFLGRLDDQVNLRGFRIEPGEIEAALEAHPGVRAAAVTLYADKPGRSRLVAFFEATTGDGPAISELVAFVKARLPDYMAPASITRLPELPRTSTGKLDRRSLPLPSGAEQQGRVLLRSQTERRVAKVWRAVLELAEVGAEDDFFALGGHSLSVMRVIARIQEQFGVEIPLQLAIEAPTVRGMAAWLDEFTSGRPPMAVMSEILATAT